MPETTLTCGQAIFTSVRTPMGEGYRIIAASRTIRPEDKQTITRYSPSHDALCTSKSDANAADQPVAGAAFYPLSAERLCVALTVCAGAEHTGRGGKRVYTHYVVFARSEFQKCGYNPFNVLRAMIRAGVAEPQLKPPPVLEELQLLLDTPPDEMRSVEPADMRTEGAGTAGARIPSPAGARIPSRTFLTPGAKVFSRRCPSSSVRRYVLQGLLDGRSLVVKLDGGWLESAEAWLMGVPGPMRWELSFGAGLKFSVGRCHRLQLLSDEKRMVKRLVAGQPLEYVDPTITAGKDDLCPSVSSSAWLSLVDHHWSSGDIATLAGRTSRPFDDTSPEARERIARLYRSMDAIPSIATEVLLAQVLHRLFPNCDHVASPLVRDGVAAAPRGGRIDGACKTTPNGWCEKEFTHQRIDGWCEKGFTHQRIDGCCEKGLGHQRIVDPSHDCKRVAGSSLSVGDAERELEGEFLHAVQGALTARFATAPWTELAQHWRTIVSIRRFGDNCASAPRRDRKGACEPTPDGWCEKGLTHQRRRDRKGAASAAALAFASPLIEQLLRTAMKDDPLAAAEAALDVASPLVGDDLSGDRPTAARDPNHSALFGEVLNHLAASAEQIAETKREHLLQVCERWRQARPQDAIIEVIRQRISAVSVGPADPASPSS